MSVLDFLVGVGWGAVCSLSLCLWLVEGLEGILIVYFHHDRDINEKLLKGGILNVFPYTILRSVNRMNYVLGINFSSSHFAENKMIANF